MKFSNEKFAINAPGGSRYDRSKVEEERELEEALEKIREMEEKDLSEKQQED